MAYDNALASLLREDLRAQAGVTERRMFGGLCFLLNGNMLCTTREAGGMYRVGEAQAAQALALPGVTPTIMRGRQMKGFVSVGRSGIADRGRREPLLHMALGFVGMLPVR
jgi:hypothetical protein